MTSPFGTRGFTLASWQEEAITAWERGDARATHRGTLEIFTGGGKTLIALECIRRAAEKHPGLRVAVVVPTEALAHQWRDVLLNRTNLRAKDIGLLGAGKKARLADVRALIVVLNTAAKVLPAQAENAQPLMLVIDECHRAGAPTFSRVLRTEAVARLGLSATPEREEFDEDGEPLLFDEQIVGRALGPVVFRFGLRQARHAGWLPTYSIKHHAVELDEGEKRRYEALTQKVDDAADKLRGLGIETTRARAFAGKRGEVAQLVDAWVRATSQRKDLLYRVRERERIVRLVVGRMVDGPTPSRVLLFHERVDEAAALFERLRSDLPEVGVGLEHSRLPTQARAAALAAFRDGKAPILVSVKSLVEGLDVPEADVGISVASSSSVRQRIQSLGRVLRRSFSIDDAIKRAEMHIVYVANTVDELIYAKEDWVDITGEGTDHFLFWKHGAPEPIPKEGPPRTPRPTEAQEWDRLGRRVPDRPTQWLGVLPFTDYSVDTKGNVKNALGSVIANPQGVEKMVEQVRGRPGGRFLVTPEQRLVIVLRDVDGEMKPFVAGALQEPFEIRDSSPPPQSVRVEALSPGDLYPGPATKEKGSYRLRQKRGGVIERSVSRQISEFALVEGADPELTANARRLLEAWRETSSSGLQFHVNKRWHAWYMEAGEPRFLAEIPKGLAWPSDVGEGAS